MARLTRMQILNHMYRGAGIVPVFYHRDPEVVCSVAQACYDGGLRIIEVANRGPGAIEAFQALEIYCKKHLPEMITGVGSIVDKASAAIFVNYGANFVVGPCMCEQVARLCNRHKIVYVPGCGSVTEILYACELGCELVKSFPGMELGGPNFIKAVRGPCPWVNFLPSGGVDITRESLSKWFGSGGVASVVIGEKLLPKALIEKREYGQLTERITEVVEIVKQVRHYVKISTQDEYADDAAAMKARSSGY